MSPIWPTGLVTMQMDGGSQAHRRPGRLAAALRERIPQLLLAGPPGDPRGRLRAGDRRRRVARPRPRPDGLGGGAAQSRWRRDLDADRVLAAPARLPLGARQRLRPADALHHPGHPPRPPQRQVASGHAPRGGDPARGPLLRRLRADLRDPDRLPALRRLHLRLPRLRLHALLRAPLRAQVEIRQAAARGAHAPPLPGSPLRLRGLLAALGRGGQDDAAASATLIRSRIRFRNTRARRASSNSKRASGSSRSSPSSSRRRATR
jgi:hypothetical protein